MAPGRHIHYYVYSYRTHEFWNALLLTYLISCFSIYTQCSCRYNVVELIIVWGTLLRNVFLMGKAWPAWWRAMGGWLGPRGSSMSER